MFIFYLSYINNYVTFVVYKTKEIMYTIKVTNQEFSKVIEVLEFKTKKDANKFLKFNTEKRGYDYFSKENRSIEYITNY